jgi:hypothetical protein
MFGGKDAHSGRPLETCNGSARTGERKRGSVLLVPTNGEPNDPSDLFFQGPFVPQLRDRHTSRRGIEDLPGQSYELAWVFFIAADEGDKEPVLDVLAVHDAMLCT